MFSVTVTSALLPSRTSVSVTTTVSPSLPTISVSDTRSHVRPPSRPVVSPKTIEAIASEPGVKTIESVAVVSPGVEPSVRFWSSTVSEIPSPTTFGPSPSVIVIGCAALEVSPSPSVMT
ncbi:hypothetical protein [Aminobacter sp. MET-1]|uniref:hypothetical protein n=1 Tax=Aminobacter sp. MET-1 TaxID=2951085 RepID=UPI00226A61E9|nr:hypothetical protein [Aminobacter sp. MET-1]MCX8571645.1 hypothetical protein [Aminobacter sp. MET-1]